MKIDTSPHFRSGLWHVLVLWAFACPIGIYGAVNDPLFASQRSFASAHTKALGDAGTAIPWTLEAGLLNPALVYSYRKEIRSVHGSVSAGYGRDSIFDRHIVPLGYSYSNGEGALGLFYRFLSGSQGTTTNEAVLNLSGQLFDKMDEQGAVDLGLNIRVERTRYGLHDLPALSVVKQTWSRDGVLDTAVTTVSEQVSPAGKVREDHAILDIGFFQSDVTTNTDFAITMRNLIGYRWTETTPSVVTEVNDSIAPDSSVIRTITSSYDSEPADTRGLLPGKYRTVRIGLAYRLQFPGGKLAFIVPADIEVLGLFDKKAKNRFTFYGGIEARIQQSYMLRLGYARAPRRIPTDISDLRNLNFFTGGAGLSIAPVKVDFYFADTEWGLNTTFDY